MIPPRQPHGPVRRIALPVLVLISTGIIVSVLVLLFRGSAPRHLRVSEPTAPTRMVVADGWVGDSAGCVVAACDAVPAGSESRLSAT